MTALAIEWQVVEFPVPIGGLTRSSKGREQFPARGSCDVPIACCQQSFDLAGHGLQFTERQIRPEALLQFKAASYVSLREHAPEMGLHGGEADPQPVRNFLMTEPGRLKLRHLPLSPGQFVHAGHSGLSPMPVSLFYK